MRNFQIRSRLVDGIAVIQPRGHLDAHNVSRFEKEILKFIRDGLYRIVINGSELEYITSAGMGVIMGYIDEVREKSGDIKLSNLNERVFETFELVGFTEIYEFHDHEEQALANFNANEPVST